MEDYQEELTLNEQVSLLHSKPSACRILDEILGLSHRSYSNWQHKLIIYQSDIQTV